MSNKSNIDKPANTPKIEIVTKVNIDKAKNGRVSTSPPPKPTKSEVKPLKK